MYRTSYNDMSKKVSFEIFLLTINVFQGESVERKNMVIPKYQGYVPIVKADSYL